MKRTVCLLLCLALVLSLFAGCTGGPSSPTGEASAPAESRSPEPETEAATETAPVTTAEPVTTAAPQPAEPLPEITWAKAFRTKSVGEGSLDAEQIAFLFNGADGSLNVTNVSKEEVYANQPERLPRTRYYEQFMAEALVEELLPAMDYAIAHGFSRLCIPTETFNYGDIYASAKYLGRTYITNLHGVGGLDITSFPREDGRTLTFVLVNMGGMEKGQLIEQYREAVAAAREIVDAIPEGMTERERMLFLYQWLTDNVRYDYDDYYMEQNWSLLYDALIRHCTVCAGYTEALYVLANLAGIDCFTVEGFVITREQSFDHIWNVARIDGQYYQFDATWDEGCQPAEYQYFGVSSDYMLENHTKYLTALSEEMLPPCPDSLMPEAVDSGTSTDPSYPIYWYYRLCNARDCSPLRMFSVFGIDEETVRPGEPKDGWITTGFSLTEFFSLLQLLMSEQQAQRFLTGKIRSESDGKLMYLVPDETAVSVRLVGLEENPDGSRTARLMVYAPDGTITERDERITLEETADSGMWRIVSVD